MLRTKIERSRLRNKRALFNRGKTLVNAFCEFNSISVPRIEEATLRSSPGTQKGRRIKVDLDKCTGALFTQNTNRWSFPGHIMDNTPYGEVCRQFGFYLLHRFKRKNPLQRMLGSNKVLGHERTEETAFAEAVRLYLTNSELLQLVSDKRYWAIRAGLRLQPVIDDSWDTVLQDAHAPSKYIKLVINAYIKEEEGEDMMPLVTERTKNYPFNELQAVKNHLIFMLDRDLQIFIEGTNSKGKSFSLEIKKTGRDPAYQVKQQNTERPEVTHNASPIFIANEFAHACLSYRKYLSPYEIASNMRRYRKTEVNLKEFAEKEVKKKKKKAIA